MAPYMGKFSGEYNPLYEKFCSAQNIAQRYSFVKNWGIILKKNYLYVLEKKSHKEIGEILGINERSSAPQLFRAKKTLAERVKEWMDEHDM